jgi:O-antigen ligase
MRHNTLPIDIKILLLLCILFFSGLRFTLPVPYSEDVGLLYPWWAIPISYGNILLYEFLFIIWLLIFGWSALVKAGGNKNIGCWKIAKWMLIFAFWTGFISLGSPQIFLDIGKTFRLILNVALLIIVANSAISHGYSLLVSLIYGFLFGTIINLYISFEFPLVVNGLMRLSGQNTPGVAMGIAVHLCAWVFYVSKSQSQKIISFLVALIFLFSSGISYSRVGWIASILGVGCWAYILFIASTDFMTECQKISLKKFRLLIMPLLFVILAFSYYFLGGIDIINWLFSLLSSKLGLDGETGDGDQQRFNYLVATIEILSDYPFGVGYSGFYDAILSTDIYNSGLMDEEVGYEANPHSSLLYFATSGGFVGLLLGVTVCIKLLKEMRNGLRNSMGKTGSILFLLILPAYFVISLTVPYLLNSIILFVPAAIISGIGLSKNKL